MKSALVSLLLLLSILPARAQQGRWDVYTSSVTFLPNVILRDRQGDSLMVEGKHSVSTVRVSTLYRLDAKFGSSKAFIPALAGGIAGGGFGFLAGKILDHNSLNPSGSSDPNSGYGLLLGLVGGGLGAIVGSELTPSRTGKSYELQNMDAAGKAHLIDQIIKAHGDTPRDAGTDLDTDSTGLQYPSGDRAHNYFRIYLGAALPGGDFADATPGTATAGGAELGLYGNVDYVIPSSPGLDYVASVGAARNTVDRKVLGIPSGVIPDLGSWWNIWPMFGMQFRPFISQVTEIYALAQGGMVVGSSPRVDITLGGNKFSQSSAMASAFAYRFGLGLVFHRKIMVDVRYMSGAPEYLIDATGPGEVRHVKTSQATQMVTCTFGLVL